MSDTIGILVERFRTMKRKFYRVNNAETQQGLWYAFSGAFTGLIHGEFNFCQNHSLVMEFDPTIVGFLSAVDKLEDLFAWFSKEDILKLQEKGWYIHEYETEDFKWYDRFSHWIINAEKSVVTQKIVLE